MGTSRKNSARGENRSVTIYLDSVGLFELDDIMSFDMTNNGTLIKKKPLGFTTYKHDITYGDYTGELKCEKTGSQAMRLAKLVEDRALQGLSTITGWITDTIQDREGRGYEVTRYADCVFEVKTISTSDGESPVTISITVTASKREFDSFIVDS